jgi:hypothetical protein
MARVSCEVELDGVSEPHTFRVMNRLTFGSAAKWGVVSVVAIAVGTLVAYGCFVAGALLFPATCAVCRPPALCSLTACVVNYRGQFVVAALAGLIAAVAAFTLMGKRLR